MEKYYEVIQQILSLLETMEEALLHIQKQLKELRYEESLELLQDSTIGIASIENAIQPIMPKLRGNNIESGIAILKDNVHKVINIYEQKKEENLEKQMQEGILPAFKNFKQETESVLKPYVAC